jgi:hypothetical protein
MNKLEAGILQLEVGTDDPDFKDKVVAYQNELSQ